MTVRKNNREISPKFYPELAGSHLPSHSLSNRSPLTRKRGDFLIDEGECAMGRVRLELESENSFLNFNSALEFNGTEAF